MTMAQARLAKTFSASTNYDEYRNTIASIKEHELPPSPPFSPEHDKEPLAFTRAALVFRDRLDGIRSKRDSTQPLISGEADKDDGSDQHGATQRVRILRGVQALLTALLSVAIAVMQGRVYIIYQNTKTVPRAWPQTPNVLPTLLLFSVAIAALVFDIALIVGYTTKGRVGKVAYEIAAGAHYVAVTAKMASFAITSIVCKVGFDFGNRSGTNDDLWSWSCTAQAAEMDSVNQANSDCATQTAAWVFALANIGIEAIGIAINLYVKVSGASDIGDGGDGGDSGEKGGSKNSKASSPKRMTPKQRRSAMGSMYSEVSSHLEDVTPEIDDKPAEQMIETQVESFRQKIGL